MDNEATSNVSQPFTVKINAGCDGMIVNWKEALRILVFPLPPLATAAQLMRIKVDLANRLQRPSSCSCNLSGSQEAGTWSANVRCPFVQTHGYYVYVFSCVCVSGFQMKGGFMLFRLAHASRYQPLYWGGLLSEPHIASSLFFGGVFFI